MGCLGESEGVGPIDLGYCAIQKGRSKRQVSNTVMIRTI